MTTAGTLTGRRLAVAMGLDETEYDAIESALGREPNHLELAVFAGMWSEHCSYKSTRALLAGLPTTGPGILAGPGSHAGCVDVGDGWAVAFKIESHNHPSAVEPYQGAATGVGGILRDVVAQGARPVAVLDALCFGDPGSPRAAFVREGVVAGIGGYGNSYGVPNVGGLTIHDARYEGNPLVNALAAGLVRHDEMRSAAAVPGAAVIYVGATTGRDGILGAAFASEELGHEDDHGGRRSHVQVGDPFMGKKLMEAVLAFTAADGLLAGQDLGACGIACATAEMAAAGGAGIEIDLEKVPLREPDMEPFEILLSESQERFMLVVDARGAEAAVGRFRSAGVAAAVCGRVVDHDRMLVRHNGEVVADLPAALVADGAPLRRWAGVESLPKAVPYPPIEPPADLGETLLSLLRLPGLGDLSPVYERYDQTVGNRTMRGPGQGEAAVLRLPGEDRAFALSLVGGGDACAVDPRLGVQCLLGEAVRNLACVGAEAVAVTDGINAGSPSDPAEFTRLAETIAGLGDGLRALGLAVTGGNCSLYNESPIGAIPPTPMIGALGLIPDRRLVPAPGFTEGDVVLLVGSPSSGPNLSAYGRLRTKEVGGPAPAPDLETDRALAGFLLEQIRAGRIRAAKDSARGGPAVALAKLCLRSGTGVRVRLEHDGRPDWALFGEPAGVAWVAIGEEHHQAVLDAATAAGLAVKASGTAGGDGLVVDGILDLAMDEVAAAFRGSP